MEKRKKRYLLRFFVFYPLYILILLEIFLRIFYYLSIHLYLSIHIPDKYQRALQQVYSQRVDPAFGLDCTYKFDPVCYILPKNKAFFRCPGPDSMTYRSSYPKEKKPGEIRIICLGDSTTIGSGVKYEESYPYLLEKLFLKKYPHKNIKVLNAGFPLSSRVLKRMFQFHLVKYKPDIVLWRAGTMLTDTYKVSTKLYFLSGKIWQILYSSLTFRISCLLIDIYLTKNHKYEGDCGMPSTSSSTRVYTFITTASSLKNLPLYDFKTDFCIVKQIATDYGIRYILAVDYLLKSTSQDIFNSDYETYKHQKINPVVKTVDALNQQLKFFSFSELSIDSSCHLTPKGYLVVAQEIFKYIEEKNWIKGLRGHNT